MVDNATPADGGLSRRELLKRAATVGAAAWTVPIVSTFNTPAFAGDPVSPINCGPWQCGDPLVVCGDDGGFCGCVNDIEGRSFCAGDIGCGAAPDCRTSDDCPEGWRCIADTCCEVPKCLPPCGTTAPQRNAEVGGTAFAG